jgi:hypothetical protein
MGIGNEQGKQNDGAKDLACKEEVEETFLLHFASSDVIARNEDISKEYGGQYAQKYQIRVCAFQVVNIWWRDERAIRKGIVCWGKRLDWGIIIVVVVQDREGCRQMDNDFVGCSRTTSRRGSSNCSWARVR